MTGMRLGDQALAAWGMGRHRVHRSV